MDDHEACPILLTNVLEYLHGAVEGIVEAGQKFFAGRVTKLLRKPVCVARHLVDGRDPFGDVTSPSDLEPVDVTLGGIDEVADDVSDLPVTGAGRHLPVLRRLRESEELLRLVAHDSQEIVLGRK